MALSNLIFTPGQVPDYASMGFKAASLIPDLAAKFQQGQKHAAEQQMAQLKYQQEKQKADLFAAIAPDLARYQQAELAMKMQQLNGMAVPGRAPGGVYQAVVRQPQGSQAVDPSMFPGFVKTGTTTGGGQEGSAPPSLYNVPPLQNTPGGNAFGTPIQLFPGAPPVGIDPSNRDAAGDIMDYSSNGNQPSFAYDFSGGEDYYG